MSYWITPACDDCGVCVLACPRGAIHCESNPVTVFEIASLDCNDCGKCAIVCPVGAIGLDPDWAVCRGRGCPLTSKRYEDWACTEAGARCPSCGGSLWLPPGYREWVCAGCELETRVMCPKIRKHNAGMPSIDVRTREARAAIPSK